jgi:hypothetical protein
MLIEERFIQKPALRIRKTNERSEASHAIGASRRSGERERV